METSEVSQAEESLTKRETADLLIRDLEAQAELMIKESRRETEAVIASITTMFKVSKKIISVHICTPKFPNSSTTKKLKTTFPRVRSIYM